MTIQANTFTLDVSPLGVVEEPDLAEFRRVLTDSIDQWILAGLADIFLPEKIVLLAPSGYAFRKPSGSRATYFIRADQALTSSGAVAFVALALLRRTLVAHGGLPRTLKTVFVDTMSVATVAFAFRELLSVAGHEPLPQVESFHSYGGMAAAGMLLPGSSLCLISASSSMNLHREWVEQKHVYDRDVVTLVTFADARGYERALFALPKDSRPGDSAPIAKYDIQIEGENFSPANEVPRRILLKTTHHACRPLTDIYFKLRDQGVFDIYRSSSATSRRSIYVDGTALLRCQCFQRWVDAQLPQWLRANTTHVVYLPNEASRTLAQHIAAVLVSLG